MIGHPPPALVQPHWLSLCLVFPKFIPASGPLHRHTGAHTPVCTHHVHMCRVIHPSGPQSLSPGITPYLQFGLLAVQVIPQKFWPQDWWDSLGSYGQCPCPHLGVGTAHVCVIWSLDSLS